MGEATDDEQETRIREDALKLADTVLYRSADNLIKHGKSKTGVNPGWAVGHFYEKSSVAHSTDFEVKLWGSEPAPDATKAKEERPSTFNKEWDAHDANGPEFIAVFSGKLTIRFGFRAPTGE